MKAYRRIVSIIILVGILGATQLFANTSTTLSINGERVEVPQDLNIREGLIPFRWMVQTMGASNISWDKGTVTVGINSFLDRYKYVNYLSGLKIKNKTLYPLPSRLENIKFPANEVYSNHLMINPTPLNLDIISQGVSIPYALYDYKIIDGRVFVGANWLNTLFLADLEYDNEKNILSVFYMKPQELASKTEELEQMITPRSAEEALALWIRGQQTRAGTLQYMALSNELKGKAITKAYQGMWVTGGSSPSLGEATVLETKELNDHTVSYKIKYNEMLQGKVWQEMEQKVVVEKRPNLENGKWAITKIENNNPYYSVLPGEIYY